MFKISECPDIVISGKKMNFNTAVSQLSQLTQEPNEPFGYHRFILKPEIENIAHQVNFRGIMANKVEPLYKELFTFQARSMIGNSQMKVGGKVYLQNGWIIGFV